MKTTTKAELILRNRNALRAEMNAMFSAIRFPPKGATVASEARRLRRMAAQTPLPPAPAPATVRASGHDAANRK